MAPRMHTFRPLLITLAALLFLGATGWYVWQKSASNHDHTIRIGINPWIGYEFLYLAEKKGFLAEEGLNVRLLQYSSLEDVRAAFERGHVDGITSTVAEVIQANVGGHRKAQVILVADFSNGADVILAKPPIRSITQLKGKNIGVEKASLGMFMLARALQKNGLTTHDVRTLAYDQPAMAKAVAEGKIDAAVTYPPYSLEIIKQGATHTLFTSAMIPGEVLDTISLDRALLTQNPEIAAAITRAWSKALAYAQAHPEESYQLMAARENITAEEFAATLKEVHIVTVEEQAELLKPGGKLEQAFTLMHRILYEAGELSTPQNPAELTEYIFRPTH